MMKRKRDCEDRGQVVGEVECEDFVLNSEGVPEPRRLSAGELICGSVSGVEGLVLVLVVREDLLFWYCFKGSQALVTVLGRNSIKVTPFM